MLVASRWDKRRCPIRQPLTETALIQFSLGASDPELSVAAVGDPLSRVPFEQLRQVAPKRWLTLLDQRRYRPIDP